MSRPYADDWVILDPALRDKGVTAPLWYSPYLDRWWRNGTIYDELSARHNGLIGMGARLKAIIND